MSVQSIERQFTRIGARAKVHPPIVRRWRATPEVSIDVGNDAEGEFFDLSIQPQLVAETQVVDVQPSLRHLLLMSRQDDGKHKFLCGTRRATLVRCGRSGASFGFIGEDSIRGTQADRGTCTRKSSWRKTAEAKPTTQCSVHPPR